MNSNHAKVICALLHNSEGLEIVEAKPEDLEIVLQILNEASEWLLSKGINQWRPEFFVRTQIMEGIRKGEVYLAKENSHVVATITLQCSDHRFWGDTPPDAGYVHKLAVKREYAGKRIGRALLEWALNQAKAAGKTYLRLNCQFENPRLRQYYVDSGFTYRGEAKLQNFRFALYEKHL